MPHAAANHQPAHPFSPRRYTELLCTGGERDASILEDLFTSVATLCKHLARPLAAQLPTVLRQTSGLRYHSADYVRGFAAQVRISGLFLPSDAMVECDHATTSHCSSCLSHMPCQSSTTHHSAS